MSPTTDRFSTWTDNLIKISPTEPTSDNTTLLLAQGPSLSHLGSVFTIIQHCCGFLEFGASLAHCRICTLQKCRKRLILKFSTYLESFKQHELLRQRILHVLNSLPYDVQQDFLSDPRFTISLDNYVPGEGSSVFMASPLGNGGGSRSVVLKPRLSKSSEAFAHYVIAHEFAHAYLRNGPWGKITDVEDAADALARTWGFIQQTRMRK